jgi:hypothetical protein
MAISERVLLFHDHPPQGAGNAEIFEAGLGLVRGAVFLPHASSRLALDDRTRVALLARRLSPAACLTLDDVRELVELARKDSAPRSGPIGLMARVQPRYRPQVLGVQSPDRGHSGTPGIAHQFRRVFGCEQLASRRLRVAEARPVQVLQRPELDLPAAVGLVKGWVLHKGRFRAFIQPQVAYGLAEVVLERTELALAFLPPSRDRCDRSLEPGPGEGIAYVGGAELRAQDQHVDHVAGH